MLASRVVLERVAVAELLSADFAHVREVVIVDAHVAVAVGVAAEALAALAAAVAALPAVLVVDVAEQGLAEAEDLSAGGAQVLLQPQTRPLVETQVLLRGKTAAALVAHLIALRHMHVLLVTFHRLQGRRPEAARRHPAAEGLRVTMLRLAMCQEPRGDAEHLRAVTARPSAAVVLGPHVQRQPLLSQEALAALLAGEAGISVFVSQVLVVRLCTLHLLVAQLAQGAAHAASLSAGPLGPGALQRQGADSRRPSQDLGGLFEPLFRCLQLVHLMTELLVNNSQKPVQAGPPTSLCTGCFQAGPPTTLYAGCFEAGPPKTLCAGRVQAGPPPSLCTGCVQAGPPKTLCAGRAQTGPPTTLCAGRVQAADRWPQAACTIYRQFKLPGVSQGRLFIICVTFPTMLQQACGAEEELLALRTLKLLSFVCHSTVACEILFVKKLPLADRAGVGGVVVQTVFQQAAFAAGPVLALGTRVGRAMDPGLVGEKLVQEDGPIHTTHHLAHKVSVDLTAVGLKRI